ncbi:hypothetical protein ABZ467_36835 [Streptomyces sp. NPDC005727]|uniref:hypothetical protein n=1 Tax=Streptomyces sp. NPDC005727 TaxID=3157053 RepID=UPI0033EAF31C
MTAATVAPTAYAGISADYIRRTYEEVLGEARIGPPELGDEKRARLGASLLVQIRVLLAHLEVRVGELSGETGKTAEHVMSRTRDALTLGLARAQDPDQLHDVACLARSLLEMCRLVAVLSPDRPPPPDTETPLSHCLP